MAVIGTFGSFTTARLGIYASQASLQVTGNNIANINTKGYTRQRADLYSLNSTGLAHYANPMGVDIGYGVLVKSTTQLRDPYLDIRFRNQNTQLGSVNATLAGLNKIAQTLDEVNKGGTSQNGIIENALQNFKTMMEGLSDTVGSEEQDVLVREAAKSLVTFFNTAAEDLQKDWDLQADELRDTIKDVNKCLTNIRDLNEQIRKQGIYGDLALELRDARNLYIDELSEYMGINVEYSLERIDQYTDVEKLTITLKDTVDPRTDPPQPIKLIDGLYGAQLSLSEYEVNPNYNPNYEAKAGEDPAVTAKYTCRYLDVNGEPVDDETKAAKVDPNKFLFQVERLEDKFGVPLNRGRSSESVIVPLDDNDLVGSLQAMRELLTEEGEFASKTDVGLDDKSAVLDPDDPKNYSALRAADSNANIKKGIPYYQKRLDLLAQKFAEIFNEANQLPASTVYETQGTSFMANGAAIEDENGHAIEFDDVTIEVAVLDANGKPVVPAETERIPLADTKRVRDALKNGTPPLTDEQIDKKIADSAKYLEVLRDKGVLKEEYEFYDGGVLFSSSGNNNDPSNITASNISISNGWASRVVRVLNRAIPYERDNAGELIRHSSDNSNILHMISLIETQLNYSASELEPDASGGDKIFFHGTFQEMYTDLGATLGSERNTIMGIASNYELMTLDLDNDRISVSGVDLNDEATSMMQFQKSYQAACRLLTTIDSMLDTLINNTLR